MDKKIQTVELTFEDGRVGTFVGKAVIHGSVDRVVVTDIVIYEPEDIPEGWTLVDSAVKLATQGE